MTVLITVDLGSAHQMLEVIQDLIIPTIWLFKESLAMSSK